MNVKLKNQIKKHTRKFGDMAIETIRPKNFNKKPKIPDCDKEEAKKKTKQFNVQKKIKI